ncbi:MULTISPECIES: protein kinase [unclassified Myxococcus]|uniref:protein kinase domain-containing protein n=1 Tax=unclassified Myxococcus TaxID=2648731 RepID=UPI0020C63422|nr:MULTISPECIES: protein kinase [unclassified Myxococcus]
MRRTHMSPLPTSASPACPDENALAGFASGVLPPADVPAMAAHLDVCEDCRALVAAVAAESSAPNPGGLSQGPTRLDSRVPSPEGEKPGVAGELLLEGTRLGPYVLRELLGVGGMGVVYAAEDPRLERRVAVKLLRPLREGIEGENRVRLSREAQAMARLSHPNVLPVFELGSVDGRDYLAMEWVEGTTLAGWLRERERPWRDVLKLFLAAGAGLVAAHQQGLVHRDFKPANVLVGRDGRPRVTDFGLARRWRREDSDARAAAEVSTTTLPLATDQEETALTREGTTPGTPAYMSPEQRQGRAVDARSDQYSFCVALYEALHGERPDRSSKRTSVEARGKKGPRLPAHVRAALARGLASEPEARHPSMEALLQALSGPSSVSKKWLGGMALVLVVLLGAGTWARAWLQPEFAPKESEAFLSEVESARKASGNVFFPMLLGEARKLELPGLSRVAIGRSDLVEIQSVENGLLLTPLSSGATHLLVWTRDGKRGLYTVSVTSP